MPATAGLITLCRFVGGRESAGNAAYPLQADVGKVRGAHDQGVSAQRFGSFLAESKGDGFVAAVDPHGIKRTVVVAAQCVGECHQCAGRACFLPHAFFHFVFGADQHGHGFIALFVGHVLLIKRHAENESGNADANGEQYQQDIAEIDDFADQGRRAVIGADFFFRDKAAVVFDGRAVNIPCAVMSAVVNIEKSGRLFFVCIERGIAS